jgi:hypothetical protein
MARNRSILRIEKDQRRIVRGWQKVFGQGRSGRSATRIRVRHGVYIIHNSQYDIPRAVKVTESYEICMEVNWSIYGAMPLLPTSSSTLVFSVQCKRPVQIKSSDGRGSHRSQPGVSFLLQSNSQITV